MQADARSDAELMGQAQSGAAPAFAVLLHRHGPAVRARLAHESDPTGATIATFLAAMRRLHRRDAAQPVAPWLLELADEQSSTPAEQPPAEPGPLDPDEADAIWAELALRWPDGRRPRHVPRWVGWVALVVVLQLLAVLVPYLVLTIGQDTDDDATPELLAVPFEETDREPAPEREQAPEIADDIEVQDLPTFDLPEPGPDEGSQPSETQDTSEPAAAACAFDPSLTEDDPGCPAPCPGDAAIPADDPGCTDGRSAGDGGGGAAPADEAPGDSTDDPGDGTTDGSDDPGEGDEADGPAEGQPTDDGETDAGEATHDPADDPGDGTPIAGGDAPAVGDPGDTDT